MTEKKEGPKPGDRIVEEIFDGDDKVLYRAVHEVVETAADNTVTSRGAARETVSGEGLALKCTEEEYFDEAFKSMQQEDGAEAQDEIALRGKKEGGGGDPVKTGLEVAKFAWEFIKDNKPVVNLETASSAVVAKGTEGLQYHSARVGTSGKYGWRAYNWPVKESTAWDIKLELGGSYQAQPPAGVAPGNYLPSIYFNIPRCDVYWPHSASASAKVTNPSNIGSADNVNAYCEVLATVNVHNVFENLTRTFKFRAEGRTGFGRL